MWLWLKQIRSTWFVLNHNVGHLFLLQNHSWFCEQATSASTLLYCKVCEVSLYPAWALLIHLLWEVRLP